MVTLERAVSQTDAQKYLEAYSIPLGPSDDSGYETRGVMVIKSKSKTRAKQRKGAVCNWKVCPCEMNCKYYVSIFVFINSVLVK